MPSPTPATNSLASSATWSGLAALSKRCFSAALFRMRSLPTGVRPSACSVQEKVSHEPFDMAGCE